MSFAVKRLVELLQRRPKLLAQVLRGLGMFACEHLDCRSPDFEVVGALTAYPWDGEGEDPNRSMLLCEHCAREYRNHWNDMWAEYHAGLL